MAQIRAKSLGGVTFDYPLHIFELDNPENILTEQMISATGEHIVWNKEILTPYITLNSKEEGWVHQLNKDSLFCMYSLLETTFTLTYTDDTTETVRIAHEKDFNFDPLYEGSEWYSVTLSLAKVLP